MNLDELVVHVKRVMPSPKLITCIENLDKANAIKFKWHKKEFVVRTNIQTFELKNGKDLFKTGMSSLIQSTLAANSNISKSITDVIDSLEESENKLARGQQSKALIELQTVEKIIKSLIRSPVKY
jgi:hypothetical protein